MGPSSSQHISSYRYALDLAHNGTILWTFQTGAPVQSAPVVNHGVLYFGSLDTYVYALNATTGAGLWSYKTGLYVSCVPAVDDEGTVYVGSYDHSFYALRAPS